MSTTTQLFLNLLMSKRDLTDCRAIITGASSGIGQALARQLAAFRAKVVLVARREDRLRELADELQSQADDVEIVVGDVSSSDARQECVRRANESFGGLDLLINNAGIGAVGTFEDSDEETLRRVMEVNFFAAAELTRIALPILRNGNRPMIVTIGSIIAHHGLPRMAEYSASKAALRGLSQSLRAELSGVVDVLLVSPATTATEFQDKAIAKPGKDADAMTSRWKSKHPLSAEQVAVKTIVAIRRGKREIFPGMSPKLIQWANRMAPWLVDWVIERTERKARAANKS